MTEVVEMGYDKGNDDASKDPWQRQERYPSCSVIWKSHKVYLSKLYAIQEGFKIDRKNRLVIIIPHKLTHPLNRWRIYLWCRGVFKWLYLRSRCAGILCGLALIINMMTRCYDIHRSRLWIDISSIFDGRREVFRVYPIRGASHVLDESLMIFFPLPWPNRWNYLFKRNVVKYIHL